MLNTTENVVLIIEGNSLLYLGSSSSYLLFNSLVLKKKNRKAERVNRVHLSFPDELVMLGNHRDAWIFGAADPSSGTAAMMELSRVLGEQLKKGTE
mgnify:FL=1